ncbi:DUF5017 domain-containing protein [Chitinophaga niabensis]|uniref:DUF5017 domain-containing protein n=1 Tax=Chitinophaga niabensis TaxID=536979 RepID=UPI0031BAF6EF
MMKNIFTLIAGFLTLTACTQKLEVSAPEFDVTQKKITARAGEEIKFLLTGNPDLITFYSGEALHDYAFAAGRIVKTNSLDFSFRSNVEFGKQTDQLRVMASVDFNGGATFEDVAAASWTDITSRFTLGTNATYKASGEANLADLSIEGKPFYLAFRYIVRNPTVYGTGNVWRIQNFLLNARTSIGPLSLGNMQNAGFRIYEQKQKTAPCRSTISTTTLQLIAPALVDSTRTVETECWIVTKGFDTGDMDYGPDRPVAIKGYADPKIKEAVYVYTTPGNYKAVFTAYNGNVAGRKEVIREVAVEITP